MRIEHLEEFLALVDTRSFSEAAVLSHVSQSGLSKHIAAIETELGAELVKRPSNPPELTRCGMSFARGARVIVNEYLAAVERVDAIKHGAEQQVVLGYWLPAARSYIKSLNAWMKRKASHFKVKPVSLSLAEIETALLDRSIDAAVTIAQDDAFENQCNSLLLKEERLLLAVSKKHPLAVFDKVKLVDLEGEVMMGPSLDYMPVVRDHLKALFGELSGYNNHPRFDDVETMLLNVEAGTGIGMVMEHNRSNYGDRIRFLSVQEEEESGFTVPLKLFWLKESEQSYSRAHIITYLKKAFASITG